MKKVRKRIWIPIAAAILLIGLVWGIWCIIRWIPTEEKALRELTVKSAEKYLGCTESDGSHQPIIDSYNTLDPLPRGYTVTYEDSWCAVFTSVAAMDAGMDELIPVECSCQQQIGQFQAMERWEESDWYLPYPGDIIYYAWGESPFGDCTGWADHVGIVANVYGPIIKVIEGNNNDAVSYRYILIGHPEIRGYGLPDYASRTDPKQ